MPRFWTVLSSEGVLFGRTYTGGLNKIPAATFNDYPLMQWHFNRLHYCATSDVEEMFSRGDQLVSVVEPVDDEEFRRVEFNPNFGTIRGANMLILGERFSLYDPETYKKLGLTMSDNPYIVQHASATANCAFLTWWDGRTDIARYYSGAMDQASLAGRVDVLEWWKKQSEKTGLALKYTSLALRTFAPTIAPESSREWWINNSCSRMPLPSDDTWLSVPFPFTSSHVMSSPVFVCWTTQQCVEQAILRLREHPSYSMLDPETIQNELIDMPFSKTILKLALEHYATCQIDPVVTICTYHECVEQVRVQLKNKLPSNFDAKECFVQTDFKLPFRKSVIKMALVRMYSQSLGVK